jgi:Domain of unknown function (DUF4384)
VNLRPRLRVALALWAAAGAGCGVIGASERLTDAQQVIADMKIGPADQQAADLKIISAVDHADRSYRVGEPIVLSMEVNQAAFVAVLQVMPSGATRLIFPNRRHASARLAANSPLSLPEVEEPVAITAENPGVVLFEFIASTRGGSWLFNRKPQEAADFAELGTTTRALAKDIALSLGAAHGTAASHLALRVRAE